MAKSTLSLAVSTGGLTLDLTPTSDSGVYRYDPATYGAASGASNDYAIYYYRGILEPAGD